MSMFSRYKYFRLMQRRLPVCHRQAGICPPAINNYRGAAMTVEKMEFKTEVKELLNLMIHSLYSHKEIFLRELISNASDAIDKARFESLTNRDIFAATGEWKIKIHVDKAAGTLTVSDNGIGMTRDEVIAELGTIAHSGTKDFLR